MQNAKDTFYQVLRDRLASVNPERTVEVRGVSRPGLLADENETESTAAMPDCFHLRWTKTSVESSGDRPLVTMTCELGYATAGTAMNVGLDRGRCLGAMDAELLASIGQTPQNTAKVDFSGLVHGLAPVTLQTRLWWSDVAFGDMQERADCLERKAVVQVMSWEEAGEL